MEKGIIFDIQRFSVHDGAGIRTNVFFKGCPLRCDWCSNPESQHPQPQPMYDRQKCIGCGRCAADCPSKAIRPGPDYSIDTAKCFVCRSYACTDRCYARALTIAGQAYTADEIVEIVKKDALFYGASGGGVTVSGGEALMQIDFLTTLLRKCREAGIGTALETCSACPWTSMERTLPYIDTYLCDVKHTDPVKLRAETGGDAGALLENIRKLAAAGAHVVARVPMIPGFNTDPEEVASIGAFIASCGIARAEILNFHRLGVPKYTKCFAGRLPREREPLTQEELEERLTILRGCGLEAAVG
jgi:pyruvate formate lyase activating enzyme